MKKILLIEIIVLVVLLIFGATLLLKDQSQPTEPSASAGVSTAGTETTTLPPETTEPTVPAWATIPSDRLLTASQYFVYDLESEAYLAASGSQTQQVYPASITKLYTAYLALQYLDPADTVTVGSELNMVSPGSSVAELEKGMTLTVEKLVEGMLLPSGNDASYVLAAAAGRAIAENPGMGAQNAVNTFIKHMNSQGAALGLTGSNWVNPDGIHKENHYTTFHDLVIIGRLAMENDIIMRYAVTTREEMDFGGDEPVEWENTNELVQPESPYYCPYAIGLKTGQTPRAGSCLLSAFDAEGRKLIIGVFGCPEVEDRFADTLQLLADALGY